MSDLWDNATRDIESENRSRALAEARAANTEVWHFLASATSEYDFETRLALVQERIDAPEDTREAMVEGWRKDAAQKRAVDMQTPLIGLDGDAYSKPGDPPVVAIIYDPVTGEEYDRAWSWETGQNYARSNYKVVAVAPDPYPYGGGAMSIEEAQAIYDTERRWAQDAFGIDDTQIIEASRKQSSSLTEEPCPRCDGDGEYLGDNTWVCEQCGEVYKIGRSGKPVTLSPGEAEHIKVTRRKTARFDDVVAYTYRADLYTPAGVIEALIQEGKASPAARDMDAESAIRQIVESNGFDYDDLYSYDSDEYPKPIFSSDLEGGEELMDETGNYVTSSRRRKTAGDQKCSVCGKAATNYAYQEGTRASGIFACDEHIGQFSEGRTVEKVGTRKTAHYLGTFDSPRQAVDAVREWAAKVGLEVEVKNYSGEGGLPVGGGEGYRKVTLSDGTTVTITNFPGHGWGVNVPYTASRKTAGSWPEDGSEYHAGRVKGATSLEQVQSYLYDNFKATERDGVIFVSGWDRAGFTWQALKDRLASGLMGLEDVSNEGAGETWASKRATRKTAAEAYWYISDDGRESGPFYRDDLEDLEGTRKDRDRRPFSEAWRALTPDEMREYGPAGKAVVFDRTSTRKTAGNPYPVGSPNWFDWEDKASGRVPSAPGEIQSGPVSGVPKDLFPEGGVPLHGDLTPEQEAWLKGASKTAGFLEPEDIPADFEVRPLQPGENPPGKTTCGTCGLSWDDDIVTGITPAPSARCPFEYFHDDEGYFASLMRVASEPIADDSGQGVSSLPADPGDPPDEDAAFDDFGWASSGEGTEEKLPEKKSGRKTAAWIDDIRDQISPNGTKGFYDTGVDNVTAGMLVQVYDALNDENKAKFDGMDVLTAADIGWKLIERTKASRKRAVVDYVTSMGGGKLFASMGPRRRAAMRRQVGFAREAIDTSNWGYQEWAEFGGNALDDMSIPMRGDTGPDYSYNHGYPEEEWADTYDSGSEYVNPPYGNFEEGGPGDYGPSERMTHSVDALTAADFPHVHPEIGEIHRSKDECAMSWCTYADLTSSAQAESRQQAQSRTSARRSRRPFARTAGSWPTGRSDYKPGKARVGQPNPQSDPDLFSSEDLLAEVKYLIGANKRWGSNPLRTMAYRELMRIISERGDLEVKASKTAAPLDEGLSLYLGSLETIAQQARDNIEKPGLGVAWAEGVEGLVGKLRAAVDEGYDQQVLQYAMKLYDKAIHANGDADMPVSVAAARAVVSAVMDDRPDWLDYRVVKAPIEDLRYFSQRRTASDPFAAQNNPFSGDNEMAQTPDYAEPGTDAPDMMGEPEVAGPAMTTKPRGGESPTTASRHQALLADVSEMLTRYHSDAYMARHDWRREVAAMTPEERDRALSDIATLEKLLGRMAETVQDPKTARRRPQAKVAMPNPVDLGVKVGDFFYTSWGYDQTNVEFFEVVGLTGASVRLREVAQNVEDRGSGSESVTPRPGAYIGEVMTKRIKDGGYDKPAVKIDYVRTGWLWDGTPKHQTAFGWGH